MIRAIRALGITVLGCTLVMMTACQSTGSKACGPGGTQACSAKAGKTCPPNCNCAKAGKKCAANCKKACCGKVGKKPSSTQAAAPQCGLDGCTKPGNPSITAMVNGKKRCFCCADCKAKAMQKLQQQKK